jgi:hypothetical protein
LKANMTFSKEEYAAVASHIDALMPWKKAWGSTVVIVIAQENEFRVFGSGTLLKIADEYLLITASHVIEQAGAKNLYIVVADRKTREDLIPLEGEAVLGNERIDVAVLQLKPSVVAGLQEGDFLRLDHFCTDENLSEAMFAIVGFPGIMSEHKEGILSFTKFFHVAPAFAGDISPLGDYDAKTHFLIDADLAETRLMDGSPMEFKAKGGQPANFPGHLGGISGGSVWKIADSPKHSTGRQPGSGKLIGVETGVYSRSKCIKATRWSVVVQMLKKALPDLRAPIDLWRGN